jgi:serine-type anaerobic sulfatase-maturating enzyme
LAARENPTGPLPPAPPRAFHVLAKPAGARCNCACDYCFYLDKEALYPGSDQRMSDEVLDGYIRQMIEAHAERPEVEFAWQGGEPTLLGLDFFRRAVGLQRRYARPGRRVRNSLQTNGLLLDEAWCGFLRENDFLVGLSLDGPRDLHDAYRRDRAGRSVFDRVLRAAGLMRRLGVEFNVLCTVNAANSRRPLDVYRFFRDELGTRYVQLIPIVEKGREGSPPVSARSVDPGDYGRFLVAVFDEWVRRDVGTMFVTLFDNVLASYVFGESSVCVFRRECGDALALEHNGDLYACDHFVAPPYRLGNILREPLADLVASEGQRSFGRAKSAALPRACRECPYLFACNGECPKNRLLTAPDGEPGLNWLCAGLKAFFAHTERPMRIMAGLLSQGRPASDVMDVLAREDEGEPGGATGPRPVRSAIPRGGRGRRGGRAR